MKILRILALLFVCLPAFGQRLVEEVANIAALKTRNAHSINKSVHVRGYWQEGDGGGGDFVVTNNVSNVDNGLKILSSQDATFSYIRQVPGAVNPKWYGAVGNGTSNDTVRLQEAITQGTAKGYGIDLGIANYLITAPLTPVDNLTLFGQGDKSIITGVSAANIFQFSSVTNILMRDFKVAGTSGVSFYATDCNNLYFQRIKQTGAVINPAGYTAGFDFEGGGNVTLDNVECSDNGINTMVLNTDYNILSGFFNNVTTNLVILNPTIHNKYSKFGIALFNAINPKIRDGYIDMNGQGTTNNADGYAIVVYGKTGVATGVRSSIIGTTITNCYGTAILYRNVLDGEIIGTQISKVSQVCSDFNLSQGAIAITKSQRIRVVNNGIYDSGINSGIAFDSSTNCLFTGNSISFPGTNRWGVEIRGYNFGATISGNSVENGHRAIGTTIGNGIADTLDIEGNFIRNVVDGIFLSGESSNNIVRGNRIYNNAGTGITDLGTYNTFVNNYMVGGVIGLYAIGTNGIISGNLTSGQTTGVNIGGNGYRMSPDNQFFNNATPISDGGGALVKILTSGTTPSVRDSRSYWLNYAVPTSITDFLDGQPDDIRTFYTANTNVTIVHGTPINLDGAGDFNIQPGDSLTIRRDLAGGWHQIGKSINSNWEYMDRASGNLIVNAPLFNRGPVSITTTPSTVTYPFDVKITTNTASSLLFNLTALGNPNSFSAILDASRSNAYIFNGVSYHLPFTQGGAGTVEVNDGSGNLLWRSIGSLYNFSTNFTVTAGTNVALATPIPVAAGGTGTNALGSAGNVLYLAAQSRMASTTALFYDQSAVTLNIARTPATTIPLIALNDGSDGIEIGGKKIRETGGDLTLDSQTNIVLSVQAQNGLKVNGDLSVLAGNGQTNVGRTTSYLYIPTSTGPPTGVPTAQSGWVALTFDTANTNLYIYLSGWKKYTWSP